MFESDRILQVNRYGKQKQFVRDNCYKEYGAITHFMGGCLAGYGGHRRRGNEWRIHGRAICMADYVAIEQKGCV